MSGAVRPSVLLAAPGLPGETGLVAACQRRGSALAIARRCVDAVDLLGSSAAGSAAVAVVGAGLPRLTREVVARLEGSGILTIGIVASGDEDSDRHLRRLEVGSVIAIDPGNPEAAIRLIAAAIPSRGPDGLDDDAAPRPHHAGHLVAVWGPTGAPGRTAVAIGLADEAARARTPALVVDADTYGGVVSTALGIWDETSGIAMACRRAEVGSLDVASLASCARSIGGGLRVLSGIAHADRWAELRPGSLRALWSACAMTPGLAVIDTGFCLERDDDQLDGSRGPRRNAATLTAIEAADVVVAVGSADAVGMARLVSALPRLREVAPDTPVIVAITRMRSSALGRDAQAQVREALADLTDVEHDLVVVADDRAGYDQCLREGRTLAEAVPRSPARAGLQQLVARVVAHAAAGAGERAA